jgi:hypothetical protein
METAIITRALFIHNLEFEPAHEVIEIHYIKQNDRKKVMYIDTFPLGNWNEIKFDPDDNVLVSDFLKTMVFRNIDVARVLARLALNRVVEHNDVMWKHYIQCMCAIRILDHTFVPPSININCGWQKDLLDSIVDKTSRCIIATCRNADRLERYAKALNEMKITSV